ncbi:hypothetical protein ACF0H5_007965 [Mactra antiquata]
MDYFLQSDVARLILRYLKENSYRKTYHCFMRECSYLQEFYNLVKAGRQPMLISHLNLITILEEWGKIKSQTDQSEESQQNYVQRSPTSSFSYDTTDETLVSDNDVTNKHKSKKSPKRNKKIKVVSKKLKSPSGKSPKSQNSPPSATIFSPKKLRSGRNREYLRNDETDGDKVNSPARSSIKSPGRSLEASLKSPVATVTVDPVVKIVTAENCIIESPTKYDKVNTSNVCNKSGNNIDDTVVNIDNIQSVVDHINNNNKTSNDKINTSGKPSDKRGTEPPSESLGITDKCLSWMNRNEREDSALDTNTGESNQGSESNAKTSDGDGDNNDNRGQEIPALHQEPVIPCLITPKKMPPSVSVNGDNLITPVKLLQTSHEHISRSPRRKKPKTPKKRNSEVSPVSLISGLSVDPMFEKILSDHRLHVKLAETCNSIVHCQNKSGMNTTNPKKEVNGQQISPGISTTFDEQETLAASKSLEEILAVDNNVHTELLSDNIDMSDPAYESLFKLFGTDRETFSEYLRKEKDKEEALEAEVEELERSNHEIICASLGIPSADASYDVDINSPRNVGVHHELFASQESKPSQRNGQITSTPCLDSVPVNFTPLLRSHELGSSPVNSTPDIFSDKKLSPCSTATQPFSPSYSHCSEQNPTTPRHHHYPAMCQSSTKSPRHVTDDVYSNPATPKSYSTSTNMLVHSTPTGPGSVRSQCSNDHFHKSSPIHPTVHSGKLPITCSPLVKADLHAASPRMVQKSTDQTLGTSIIPPSAAANNGLYFNSQQKLIPTSTPIDSVHSQVPFVCLLNDNTVHGQPCSNTDSSMPGGSCSTIDNSIGCISLPSSARKEAADNLSTRKSQCADATKEKLKNSVQGKDFSALKGLLAKPLKHGMAISLGYTALELTEALGKTGDLALNKSGEQSLTFHSPNGKSSFQVPILDCQDKPVIDLFGAENDADQTINVYDESLDTSAQYCLAPENQSTKDLVNAIKAGCSSDVLHKIQSQPTSNVNDTKKTKPKKNTRKKKDQSDDKTNNNKNDLSDEGSMPGVTPTVTNTELDHDQIIFTATPLNAMKRATTVRALNFGPTEDQLQNKCRKILPKVPTMSTVVIINNDQDINSTSEETLNTSKTSGTVNKKIEAKESPLKNSPMKRSRKSSVKNSPIKKSKTSPVKKSPTKKPSALKCGSKSENSNTSDVNMENADNSSDAVIISDEDSSDRRMTRNRKKARKSKEIMTVKLPVKNSSSNKEKKKKSVEEPKGSILSFFKPKTKETISDHKENCTQSQSKRRGETKDKKASVSTGNKRTGSTRTRREEKKVYKSVAIVSDSESSSDEKERVSLTPKKNSSEILDTEKKTDTNTDTTSKAILLEKIGLTPKKLVTESEEIFMSPSRANALDVLAEWQRSPSSLRKTPVTRSRFARIEERNSPFKSPVKTPRKTPAKKLFTSPCKKQTANVPKKNTRATAERVNSMIAQIKRDHPNSRLPSPLKGPGEKSDIIDHEFFNNEREVVNEGEKIETNSDKGNSKSKNRKGTGKKSEIIDNEFSNNDTELVAESEKIEKGNERVHGRSKNDVNDRKVKMKSKHSSKVKDLASDSDTVDYKIDLESVNKEKSVLSDVSETNIENCDNVTAESGNVLNEHCEAVTAKSNNVLSEQCDTVITRGDNVYHEHTHSDSSVIDDDESNTCNNVHIDNNENDENIDETVELEAHSGVVKDITDKLDMSDGESVEAKASCTNIDNNTDASPNTTNNSINDHTHIVLADIHAPPANVDTVDIVEEETRNVNQDADVTNDVEMTNVNQNSSSCDKNVNEVEDDIEIHAPNDGEIDRVDKKAEKRKKHKHRHKHKRKHTSGENRQVGDFFVSPNNSKEHKHHRHHHKKKKSHKRKREREDSEEHNSKRHKKNKSKVDDLSKLNVDEALSQIYN